MGAPDLTLYLVTDSDLCPLEKLPETVELAIEGGVTLVQLREKKATTRRFLEAAHAVKQVTDFHRVPLIINDRLDVALALNADGLHIGQDDLPASIARRILGPEKYLGVSCHTVEEALQAARDGADHLGLGAIFPTGTKEVDSCLTATQLRTIRQASGLPAVAIGGIKVDNAGALRGSFVDGIAVVSAILCAKDPKEAAMALRSAYLAAGVRDAI